MSNFEQIMMTKDSIYVTYENDGKIAIIHLNRPKKYNALTLAMAESFPRILKEIEIDDNVKVVILTGKKKKSVFFRRFIKA